MLSAVGALGGLATSPATFVSHSPLPGAVVFGLQLALVLGSLAWPALAIAYLVAFKRKGACTPTPELVAYLGLLWPVGLGTVVFLRGLL